MSKLASLIAQLKSDTSIMTMSHDTVSQMNKYDSVVKWTATKMLENNASYNGALSYIRSNG